MNLSSTSKEHTAAASTSIVLEYAAASTNIDLEYADASTNIDLEHISRSNDGNNPWRGVMIDVSRHFYPIDFLYRQVDAMSHFGLNKLHLHLTDAAGWRLEIKSRPRLTQLAAWRTDRNWKVWWNDGKRHYAEEQSDSAHGGYYTQEEMRRLVSHADSLGVLIVPEIEFPAHSEEVTAAYPELGCTGRPYECADFCLGNEASYQFIEDVVNEIKDIFSSPYLHLGGDEAGGSHWMDCPKCKTKMQELGLTTRQELQHYAMNRVAAIANRHGLTPIFWDEAVTLSDKELGSTHEKPIALSDKEMGATTTSKKPIIMVWRDVNLAEQAIKKGHDVILSPGRWYYLDAYQDAPMNEPEAMGGYTPLQKVWEGPKLDGLYALEKQETPEELESIEELETIEKLDALEELESIASQARLLGRQVNLWTEYVPDERHAERMLWPRALALSPQAEKMKQEDKNYGKFHKWVIKEALPWLQNHDIQPFPLEKEVGQRPEYNKPIHCLSTGKKVQYLAPYYEGYKAAGEATLTDGLRGGWTNTDGRWQGFISRGRLDVVIDLERMETLHSIKAGFMQSLGPEIYLPENIRISTSLDGKDYTLLYADNHAQSEQAMDYQTLGWEADKKESKKQKQTSGKKQAGASQKQADKKTASKARFVRFQALAGSRGGWVFADEIMIK